MSEIFSNSIITLAFLLLLFIPLYILNRSGVKKNREKLLRRFREFCAEKGLSPADTILVDNRVIGFDTTKNAVAGLLVGTEAEEQFFIDGGKVSKSEVVKTLSQSSVTDIKLLYSTKEGQHKQVVFYTRYKDDERKIGRLTEAAETVNSFLQRNSANPRV